MRWDLTIALAAAVLASGCGSSQEIELCGQIPEGGCPIGRGGTCDDVYCAALYDCVHGSWTRGATCPGGATGGVGGATGAGGGAGGAGGTCEPIVLDHTGEKTGCKPDLQVPDCPVVAAETCASSACLTDCTDFFLCTADGWTPKAYCDDRGLVHTR